MDAKYLINLLELSPLPKEGGYYKETYRSGEIIQSSNLPERYSGTRNFGTAIYYLLTPDCVSRMHSLHSDEIFHFYLGDPVTMLLLGPDDTTLPTCNRPSQVITLGTDLAFGEKPQCIVPCGTWMGASLKPGGKFALLGTTVAPGFEFADYIDANRDELISNYPEHSDLIRQLTIDNHV